MQITRPSMTAKCSSHLCVGALLHTSNVVCVLQTTTSADVSGDLTTVVTGSTLTIQRSGAAAGEVALNTQMTVSGV